jgi:hypothetical protein
MKNNKEYISWHNNDRYIPDPWDEIAKLEQELKQMAITEFALREYIEKLEHENETLRKSMKSITPFLAELVKVFDYAQTNGDLFDLADVCIKYRDAIDTAQKEQREQKIKQMTRNDN